MRCGAVWCGVVWYGMVDSMTTGVVAVELGLGCLLNPTLHLTLYHSVCVFVCTASTTCGMKDERSYQDTLTAS